MPLLNTLELKLGHLAIPGLIRAVVGINLIVFVAYKLNPEILPLLALDPALVMQGEIWRLVTYIFIPSFGHPMIEYINVFFYLYFLWIVGDGLEHAWGTFKLNLFYLTGMLGTTIAAFLFPGFSSNGLLNTSLLFAFATLFPDFQMLLFLILPIRIKWVAWFTFALVVFGFLGGSWNMRAATVAALGNYLLFFWQPILELTQNRRFIAKRRRDFQIKSAPDSDSLHECAVCHRTEVGNPELDFRVARDGEEYCTEHLPARV